MKKNLILTGGVFLIFCLTFLYCSKRSNQSKSDQAIPFVQPLSVAKSIDPNASYDMGKISIKTNASGDIVVGTNLQDSNNSKLYIVQGTSGKENLNKSFNGEVLYALHFIIINSLDTKERYYLSVVKPEEKLILGNIPASYKAFFTSSMNGYDVVKMTGHLPANLDIFNGNSETYADLANYRTITYGNNQSNKIVASGCDNGGEGATSCSQTQGGGQSCSVSCGAGYYACCSGGVFSPTCNCKQKAKPIGQ